MESFWASRPNGPGRAGAQQPRHLGDVRLLRPAAGMCAAPVGAGVPGAALAHLAAAVDGDLPGLRKPGQGGNLAGQNGCDG